jgi:hypothetical protein
MGQVRDNSGPKLATFFYFTTKGGAEPFDQSTNAWVDLMPQQSVLGLRRFSLSYLIIVPPGGIVPPVISSGNVQIRVLTYCGGVQSVEFATPFIAANIVNYSGRHDWEGSIESMAIQGACSAAVVGFATIAPVYAAITVIGEP